MSFRRWCGIGVVFSLIAFGLIAAIPGTALAAVITNPAGPLTSVSIGTGLNCQVNVLGDTKGEWFSSAGMCGTFLSLGGTTYKPSSVTYVTGTSYTPVSQTPVTGSGTAADPYQIVTTVQAGSTATLTQTDRYVAGNDYYTTDMTVTSTDPSLLSGNVWTAGDCVAGSSDSGYGLVTGTAPACAVTQAANSRGTALIPRTSGNSSSTVTGNVLS